MQEPLTQEILLRSLLEDLAGHPDEAVTEVAAGDHLIAVKSQRVGLASWAARNHSLPTPVDERALFVPSAKQLAAWLLSKDAQQASIGLATVNSLLPQPPLRNLQTVKAQELILHHGKGKNVAVIGHFPFVEQMGGEFHRFWVLEKRPRNGDLQAEEAQDVLPLADVIAISGTTLANGTLAGLLRCASPQAWKILLGPSTPLSPTLFDSGVDALAGITITDEGLLLDSIRKGLPAKALQGIKPVVWQR